MVDQFGRTIDYMRISVTDRCNLRCVYCMPQEGVPSVSHNEILSYEEILRVVKSAADLGISKIKITGGEPLVRKGIVDFIRRVKLTPGIKNVTLTTNGVLFAQLGKALADVGIDGVNFSLDCLDENVYQQITRSGTLSNVLQAVDQSLELGLNTKINCVPIAKYNSGEWLTLAELAKNLPLSVRFIEVMPIGLGRDFTPVKNSLVMTKLIREFGQPQPMGASLGNGPARYFKFDGFMGSIGLISAMSDSFCASCNRIRLTSDGTLKPCLCYSEGVSLRPLLRSDADDNTLRNKIQNAIQSKPLRHNLCGEADETSETKNMAQIGG